MARYERGAHGKRREMKATILSEVIKGRESLEELRTDIKREEALKNSKDVTYHLMRGKNSLKGMGLIAIRGRKVTLTVKDTEGLVTVMSILLSNDEIFWRILPELASLHRMAWLFVHDKWHFQYYLDLFGWPTDEVARFKRKIWRARREGWWNKEEAMRVYVGDTDFCRHVPLIIYAMGENIQLDSYVKNGIHNPPFRVVGSVSAIDLHDIRFAPSGIRENDAPYLAPRNEERAVNEFIEEFLSPCLRGRVPNLSMFRPSKERLEMLRLIDRAEMTLSSLRDTTALDVARLTVDKNKRIDVSVRDPVSVMETEVACPFSDE